jgi:hypothetical protein
MADQGGALAKTAWLQAGKGRHRRPAVDATDLLPSKGLQDVFESPAPFRIG